MIAALPMLGEKMANLPGIEVAYGHELAQLWLITERVGYSDSGFSRLLRRTLPDEFRSRVLEEIKKL